VVGAMTSAGLIVGGRSIERRATWAFVLALASSILILLNSAALLQPGFWGPPTNWSAVFWWLSDLGQAFAVLIGVITGLTVMSGGLAMILRRGVMGALIAFPFAVASCIIGGGFVAGAVLGIVAGILAALGR